MCHHLASSFAAPETRVDGRNGLVPPRPEPATHGPAACPLGSLFLHDAIGLKVMPDTEKTPAQLGGT